jgi:glycosyltransferase involved in cell wall biosynthesis
MRISIVLGPFFPVPTVLGGAVEKVHLGLAEAYAAAGHEVTMVSRRYADLPIREIANGVTHIRVPSQNRTKSMPANFAADLRYSLRVAQCLPQSDITVTNSFFLPLVLRRRTAGKIYVHVARFPKNQMFLYSRADRLQSISQAVARGIVRQAPWLTSKVVTIGYPVANAYFDSPQADARRETILYVGRIAREKGVHLLLKALRTLVETRDTAGVRRWKLLIVGPHEAALGGDGPEYLSELKKLAEPLGTACEFAGPLFREEDLIGVYRSSAIFVYPSLAEKGEAFGLAPLEAMAAGCSVIVSNLPCFGDFVDDGKNALRFDHSCERPEDRLAERLAQLMTDRQSLDRIARNGSVSARQFLLPVVAGKMLADFNSLLMANG